MILAVNHGGLSDTACVDDSTMENCSAACRGSFQNQGDELWILCQTLADYTQSAWKSLWVCYSTERNGKDRGIRDLLDAHRLENWASTEVSYLHRSCWSHLNQIPGPGSGSPGEGAAGRCTDLPFSLAVIFIGCLGPGP